MRMRKKKHGKERIAACSDILFTPNEADLPISPSSLFPIEKPVHLEIGCGKGNFAVGMAQSHPDFNFLAVERVADVACIALEKAKSSMNACENIRFLIANAQQLSSVFTPHSFSDLYLNFSDPWPKKGYAKRRLTHRLFLEEYRNLLVPGGKLHFKTDNEDLFRFSLEEFDACHLTVLWQTDDLHNSTYMIGNVETEYEHNFIMQGKPIHAALVSFGS